MKCEFIVESKDQLDRKHIHPCDKAAASYELRGEMNVPVRMSLCDFHRSFIQRKYGWSVERPNEQIQYPAQTT